MALLLYLQIMIGNIEKWVFNMETVIQTFFTKIIFYNKNYQLKIVIPQLWVLEHIRRHLYKKIDVP